MSEKPLLELIQKLTTERDVARTELAEVRRELLATEESAHRQRQRAKEAEFLSERLRVRLNRAVEHSTECESRMWAALGSEVAVDLKGQLSATRALALDECERLAMVEWFGSKRNASEREAGWRIAESIRDLMTKEMP